MSMELNTKNQKVVFYIWIGLMVFGLFIFLDQPKAGDIAASQAIAVLHPTQEHQVAGKVMFTETSEGIKIQGDLTGLSPGSHGFHIHQRGDCSAADGTSAGGHFNPFQNAHGGPDNGQRHVGDLGNIVAQPDGRAHYERVDKAVSLEGPDTIIGRSVIIHAGEDDFKSQPTGNAGSRLACGVIGDRR
jgi:Cu-Zn family superoxide dismutase